MSGTLTTNDGIYIKSLPMVARFLAYHFCFVCRKPKILGKKLYPGLVCMQRTRGDRSNRFTIKTLHVTQTGLVVWVETSVASCG
jgi:hypothetical protein